MKTLRIMLCALMGLLTLQCCAQKKSKAMNNGTTSGKKVLVAYFSATGTTKATAEKLAAVMGGDLHEIKPEIPYTSEDLDWTDKQSRSTLEMKDLSSRPAITGKLANMSDYDVVFIGFPIWWYTAPTIINTFIESYDLQGKMLIPFATSGGSSIEKSCKDLQATYPELNWKQGQLLNNPQKATLEKWKAVLEM